MSSSSFVSSTFIKSASNGLNKQHQTNVLTCNLERSTTPPAPSTSSQHTISRRACLLGALSLASFASLPDKAFADGAAAAPKETIVNSVLSAYGLPTLSDKAGFALLTQQYGKLIVQFEYPVAWVVNRGVPGTTIPMEGKYSSLTAADYRRAEGLSLFTSPVTQRNVRDVPVKDIVDLVTPGDAATGQSLAAKVVGDRLVEEEDGKSFRVIDTRYESTTVSGYTVERKARTKCTVLKDGKLYALNGSCSLNRWKKVGDNIGTSIDSFRVFIL